MTARFSPWKFMSNHSSRAQAMVEFALALPIFLLVVYGVIEASRAVFLDAAVTTASREGARFASAAGLDDAGYLHYQDCVGIRRAANSVGFYLNLSTTSTTDIQITYSLRQPNGTITTIDCTKTTTGPQTTVIVNTGDFVTVKVKKQFSPILPLVPFTSYQMQAKSSRTLTGEIDLNAK